MYKRNKDESGPWSGLLSLFSGLFVVLLVAAVGAFVVSFLDGLDTSLIDVLTYNTFY